MKIRKIEKIKLLMISLFLITTIILPGYYPKISELSEFILITQNTIFK